MQKWIGLNIIQRDSSMHHLWNLKMLSILRGKVHFLILFCSCIEIKYNLDLY